MAARLWVVPRLWPGADCYILGGGPSLALVDLEKLRGQRTIAVNQAYKVAPWADALFYGDAEWSRYNWDGLCTFAGLKVTTVREDLGKPAIHVVERIMGTPGICLAAHRLAWNLSSGACAMNLAYHFGVRRIILLGFDMHRERGDNWHKDYDSQPYHARPTAQSYRKYLTAFPHIAADLARMKVDVVNATPGSKITAWPTVHPNELGIGHDTPAPVEGADPC